MESISRVSSLLETGIISYNRHAGGRALTVTQHEISLSKPPSLPVPTAASAAERQSEMSHSSRSKNCWIAGMIGRSWKGSGKSSP